MLNIAICDDEPAVAAAIAALLNDLKPKYAQKLSVDTFATGEGFIERIENKAAYDIIYLDVELGGVNGVDIGRLIRRQSAETLIVFISSYDKYYKPAFDVQPFNFMDKPINEKEFELIFDRMYNRVFSNANLFGYSVNKSDKRIPFRDINYFESDKRQITIHTTLGSDTFYGSIEGLTKETKGKGFIRAHQSFLINYGYIAEFTYSEIRLGNGVSITIPANRRKTVREEYLRLKRREFSHDE